MKLAHKIFISQVIIVFLVISIYSFLSNSNMLSSGFKRELNLCNQTAAGYRYYYSTVLSALKDTGVTNKKEIIRYLENSNFIKEGGQELLLSCGEETILSTLTSAGIAKSLPQGKEGEMGNWIYKEAEKWYVCYISHFNVENETYSLLNVQDISYLFLEKDKQFQFYLKLLLYITIVVSIISAFTTWRITNPLKRLKIAAQRFSYGYLSSRSRVKGKDEVAELSEVFDKMADTVQLQMEELKDSVRKQEEFSAGFVHEMKTPLTSVIGYAGILRSERLSEEETFRTADYIFKEGKRMEELSMQLLDLIVIKNQKWDMEQVSVPCFLNEVRERMQPLLQKEEVMMRIDAVEYQLSVVPNLFAVLWQNIITNSIYAMEENKHKQLNITGKETAGHYHITVTDNGKGMKSEDLAHITELFYRVDKSRNRKRGGNGVGLSLCRQIVELHKGTMEFTSKEGTGTSVICHFKKCKEGEE